MGNPTPQGTSASPLTNACINNHPTTNRVLAINNKLSSVSCSIYKQILLNRPQFQSYLQSSLPLDYAWGSAFSRYLKSNEQQLYRSYLQLVNIYSFGTCIRPRLSALIHDHTVLSVFEANLLCKYQTDDQPKDPLLDYIQIIRQTRAYLLALDRIGSIVSNHNKENSCKPDFSAKTLQIQRLSNFNLTQTIYDLLLRKCRLAYGQELERIERALKNREYQMSVKADTTRINRKTARILYQFSKKQSSLDVKERCLEKFWENIDYSHQTQQKPGELCGRDRVISCIIQYLNNRDIYLDLVVLSDLGNRPSVGIREVYQKTAYRKHEATLEEEAYE